VIPRRARSHLVAVTALMAAAWALGGCAAMPDQRRATFGIDFRIPGAPERPAAIVFFVDGVNREVFDQLLKAGRLPTIQKYFVDRGLYAERCVANIPSVTLPNETSFVTGVFCGRHGITGNNWFDRNRLMSRNYEEVNQKNTLDGDYLAPTIFERLPDAMTMSLFFQAHRGATKFVENWLSAGPPYFFGWYNFVDRICLWRFEIVAELARARGEFPAFTIAYLLAPDMEAYGAGISSDAYRQALEHADAHIGRVLRDLEAAGRLERTVIVLASDHGMMDVTRHWSIEKFLRDDLGLAVSGEGLAEDFRFQLRLAYYRRFTCVLAGSGDRCWCIYLRKPRAGPGDSAKPAFENWLARPSPDDLRSYPTRDGKRVDLIQRLREAEAVDVVAYKAGENVVHVATKKGLVEVARDGPAGRTLTCRILQGDDPLGYAAAMPTYTLYGKPYDRDVWLDATADTEYPDLVPQIVTYFDARRTGDIVIFAAPGWDFHHRNKGGHGGVRPPEMYTVLLMAGPGVPRERRTTAVRAVDVMPTLLDLLGRPVPTDLDGRSLLRKP